MEMMDSNTILVLLSIPMVIGALLILPTGNSLSASLSEKFPSLKTQRGRLLTGSMLIAFSGFIISAMTLWISNTISEGAGFCVASSMFSCDDVLGNEEYNKMPMLGIRWALFGIIIYTFFLWLLMSINKEPHADWVGTNIKLGFMITSMGIFAIAWLMYAESVMRKICPYCTAAHIGNLLLIYGFWEMGKLYDSKDWDQN